MPENNGLNIKVFFLIEVIHRNKYKALNDDLCAFMSRWT